jgi:hypothetical protein
METCQRTRPGDQACHDVIRNLPVAIELEWLSSELVGRHDGYHESSDVGCASTFIATVVKVGRIRKRAEPVKGWFAKDYLGNRLES